VEPVYSALRSADGLPFQLLDLVRGDNERLVTENIRDRVRECRPASAVEIQRIAAVRDAERARVLTFMERWPILVMPVACVPAYEPHPTRYDSPVDFVVDGSLAPRLKALSCTAAISALGLPAAVIRAGTSRDGLPVGVQIVGRPYTDARVLAVATSVMRLIDVSSQSVVRGPTLQTNSK
jgi:amidase